MALSVDDARLPFASASTDDTVDNDVGSVFLVLFYLELAHSDGV